MILRRRVPTPAALFVWAAITTAGLPAPAVAASPVAREATGTVSLSAPDPATRTAAARALAVDPAALDVLAAALAREEHPAVRRALTDAMGRLPLDEGQLRSALATSGEPGARAWAAHALGGYRTPESAAALLAALADPSELVRAEVCRALAAAGERAGLSALTRVATKDPSPTVRRVATQAAEAVAGAPPNPVDITADLGRLATGPAESRAAAARRLGEAGDRRALAPLLAAAREADATVAQAALGALGRLGDARAVPPVLGLLGTTNGRTRYAVLGALAALRDESTVPAVAALLHDSDPGARRLAVRALAWIAPDDLFAWLDPAWQDPVEEVRFELLRAAAESASPTRIAALRRALADPSPFVRAEAVQVAAQAGITDRIPALLQDPDALVRLAAADALLVLRPPGAAEAVRAAAKKARDSQERAHLEDVAARLDGTGLPMPASGQ